ncbi:MAG: DUF969 domain-containing protein [Caulobacteraceae bacterium]
MLSLLGILVVVVGLFFRMNPILVVTTGAIVTGLLGGLPLHGVIAALGKAFNEARFISIAFLVLPVVGLLERAGLQERSAHLVSRLRGLSVARLLGGYMIVRQLSASLGLPIGGQANMVRPLLAPMALAADEAKNGPAEERRSALIRAHAAAVDNIGAYFGEDIFIALGSVLLIVAVLRQNRIEIAPLQVAFWAIPTALLALAVHQTRIFLLGRTLREAKPAPAGGASEGEEEAPHAEPQGQSR